MVVEPRSSSSNLPGESYEEGDAGTGLYRLILLPVEPAVVFHNVVYLNPLETWSITTLEKAVCLNLHSAPCEGMKLSFTIPNKYRFLIVLKVLWRYIYTLSVYPFAGA